MFQGLEHIAIATPNPERLAQWYVDTLGFTINYRYGPNVFVKAPNGTMLEIIPSEGEIRPQKPKDPGIRHLAIVPDDFQAGYERLRSQGVTFITDVIEIEGNRLVFFNDPDGNILHLIHRPQPLP
jgi:glyoxylase I family protein